MSTTSAPPPLMIPAPQPQAPGAAEADIVLGSAYDVRLMRRLWRYIRPHWHLLVAWAVFMPITIAFDLAQPLMLKAAVDHIAASNIDALITDGSLFMVFVLGNGISGYCEQWYLQLAGQRTMHDLRISIFDHVLAQRAAFFDRIPVGRLMTRMTNDIESLNEMFAQGAITLLSDFLKMMGIVVIMCTIDAPLTLLAFVTLPALYILVEYARRMMRRSFRQIRVRLAAMNAFAQEHLSGIRVVQLLGRGKIALGEYDEINAGHRDAYLDQIRADAAMYALVEAIGTIASAIVLYYASGHRLATAVMVGQVVAFVVYIDKFFTPVKDMSAKYAVMQGAMAACERIVQLLDTQEFDGQGAPPGAPSTPAAVAGPVPAIELDQVFFSYGAEPVLRGIDVRVPPGATVAIVGATGSGKSTVIKLLTRLYERERGAIRIDGTDIRDLPLAELRRRITVVSQDVLLFAGTLADNLAMGQAFSRAQIEAAVARVGLDRALTRRGADITAQVTERGSNFSAGERQLVAFARALLRDPEILILDEATAHVDPEAEGLIERGVAELMKGRTTLVIAHRLSTIRNADLIVVMDKGVVVEQGTHSELVARGGFYAALERTFRRQH